MTTFYDRIILTAPSEEKAVVYLQQLQRLKHRVKLPLLAGSKLHCFADPAGVRIGSGGGTLHALLCLSHDEQESLKTERVLLIHSGGDARRSPAYSICGKAWMTLFDESEQFQPTSALVQLLNQLSVLTDKLPIGSLVVACSDVLLSFDALPSDINLTEGSSIYLLVIPAPVTVAVNHGVVQYHNQTDLKSSPALVKSVDVYLQKPSIAVLHEKQACYDLDDEEGALVDSGVVIFTCEAFQSLLNLQRTSLVSLSESYNAQQNEYQRFELYSELLLACRTTATHDQNFEDYLLDINFKNHSNTSHLLGLQQLWQSFHCFSLQFLLPPRSCFIHLGTTREILALLCTHNLNNESNDVVLLNALCNVSSSNLTSKHEKKNIIIEHSICSESTLTSSVGGFFSHIPHSKIFNEMPNLSRVGSFLVQWIPLQHSLDSVLLILDVNDDPKASFEQGTICSSPWILFIEQMGCKIADIWPDTGSVTEGNTLWTAKVFPIVRNETGALSLAKVVMDLALLDSNMKQQWDGSERVSLSDLLHRGDAEAMFIWRTLLEIFIDRYHKRGDWSALHDLMVLWRKLRLVFDGVLLPQFASGVLLLTLIQLVVNDFSNVNLFVISSFTSISTANLIAMSDEIKQSVALTKVSSQWPLWISLLVELIYENNLLISVFKVCFECILDESVVKEEQKAKMMLMLAHCLLFRHLSQSIPTLSLSADEINTIAMSASPVRSLLLSSSWLQTMDRLTVEAAAQAITRHQMNVSLHHHLHTTSIPIIKPILDVNKVTICTAPARVDLAGGWSDTPPICWDLPLAQHACVLNMAVKVDGRRSLRATCCLLANMPGITVRCLAKDPTIIIAQETYVTCSELYRVVQSDSACALPKACAVVVFQLLLTPKSESSTATLAQDIDLLQMLRRCCAIGVNNGLFGLLLTSQSELPAGSGMGGSSILAATILQALYYHLTQTTLTQEQLIYLVLQVEQLMTTGGGWQDQVGGVISGVKVARSASTLPLTVTFNTLQVSTMFTARLAQRSVLLYTGTQRLARDTLIQALRRYSVLPPLPSATNIDSLNILTQLVQTAEEGCLLLQRYAGNEDMTLEEIDTIIDQLGTILSRYWQQKVMMAPGSDPPHIMSIFHRLSGYCVGMSLCGAGAGGFAMLILKREELSSLSAVQSEVDVMNSQERGEGEDDSNRLSLHAVEIDMDGLLVEVKER